jgi:tripartite-type tricarboxylate transporter receptor subunit TctC
MEEMMKKIVALAFASLVATPALAQDYFAGKNVTILVASSTGGGLDTYARLVGRHFQKHIPGRPNIVVQNMPGAGGNIVAQNIYNIAPKDGTVMGVTFPSVIVDPLLTEDLAVYGPPGQRVGRPATWGPWAGRRFAFATTRRSRSAPAT